MTAKASKILGAGREKKTDIIDYSAGVYLNKKTGEVVKENEPIATIYTNIKDTKIAADMVMEAFKFSKELPEEKSLIFAVIE